MTICTRLWAGQVYLEILKRSVYKDQFCSDAGTVLLPRLLPGWEEKLYHMHLHMRGWLQMSSVFVRAFMFPLSQTVSGWEEKYVAGSYRWTGLCPDIYVSDFPDSGLTFTLVIHEAVTEALLCKTLWCGIKYSLSLYINNPIENNKFN